MLQKYNSIKRKRKECLIENFHEEEKCINNLLY